MVRCLFWDRVKIAHFLLWKEIRTKLQTAGPTHRHVRCSLPVLLAVLQNKINLFAIPPIGSKDVFSQAPEQTLRAFLSMNAHLHWKPLFFFFLSSHPFPKWWNEMIWCWCWLCRMGMGTRRMWVVVLTEIPLPSSISSPGSPQSSPNHSPCLASSSTQHIRFPMFCLETTFSLIVIR